MRSNVVPLPVRGPRPRLAAVSAELRAAESAVERAAWIGYAKGVMGAAGGAVLDLHDPEERSGQVWCAGCETACADCGDEPWPCATVIVLAQAAGLDLPPVGR